MVPILFSEDWLYLIENNIGWVIAANLFVYLLLSVLCVGRNNYAKLQRREIICGLQRSVT